MHRKKKKYNEKKNKVAGLNRQVIIYDLKLLFLYKTTIFIAYINVSWRTSISWQRRDGWKCDALELRYWCLMRSAVNCDAN